MKTTTRTVRMTHYENFPIQIIGDSDSYAVYDPKAWEGINENILRPEFHLANFESILDAFKFIRKTIKERAE